MDDRPLERWLTHLLSNSVPCCRSPMMFFYIPTIVQWLEQSLFWSGEGAVAPRKSKPFQQSRCTVLDGFTLKLYTLRTVSFSILLCEGSMSVMSPHSHWWALYMCVFLPLLPRNMKMDIVNHKMPSENDVHVARSFLTKILRNSMRYSFVYGFMLITSIELFSTSFPLPIIHE